MSGDGRGCNTLTGSFEVFQAEVGAEHPSTRDAAQRLVKLYERMGRVDKADRYRVDVGE